MLQRLRQLDVNRLQTEDAIELVMYAKLYRAEFTAHDVDVPEWLEDAIRSLTREIAARQQDELHRQLRELQTAQQSDLTPTERREHRAEQIAKIEQRLGLKQPA